jgi:hypothetical protein
VRNHTVAPAGLFSDLMSALTSFNVTASASDGDVDATWVL